MSIKKIVLGKWTLTEANNIKEDYGSDKYVTERATRYSCHIKTYYG